MDTTFYFFTGNESVHIFSQLVHVFFVSTLKKQDYNAHVMFSFFLTNNSEIINK